jgi:ubiquinone/menaquinone biosynthesis C-methylase UbiE
LELGGGRHAAVVCDGCETRYPILDGVIDMLPANRAIQPGQYRTESLFDLIANIYDVVMPPMSLGIWHCSPLRYVDAENRALGRANGGVYLTAPVGTAVVTDHALAPYHDVTVLGIDTSWNMLKRAHKRLRSHPQKIQLIRAEMTRLPVRTGVATSTQSVNGLHTFLDRQATVAELLRATRPGGYVAGSALIRGQEVMADAVLDRFERYGVYPMLRSGRYMVEELKNCGMRNVSYETYGAVLFYAAESPPRLVERTKRTG